MKLTAAASLFFALLSVIPGTNAGGGGGGGKRSPPSKCAHHGKMLVEDDVRPDEALCDGGWKFGINKKGTFGLWNDNGKLIKTYATDADFMEVYEDDDDVALWVYGGKDGDLIWEVYCGSDQKYETGKIRLRMNSDVKNILRLTATDPPLDKLMRIKKNGKVKLDKRFCTLSTY